MRERSKKKKQEEQQEKDAERTRQNMASCFLPISLDFLDILARKTRQKPRKLAILWRGQSARHTLPLSS